MFHLANRELRVDVLDPAAEAARLGPRYCWGGYIWQVHDRAAGPLLTGPEWPNPTPLAFNGQGLPESFRHRTREGAPLTWQGNRGVALGAGALSADAAGGVTLEAPSDWIITSDGDDALIFRTHHAAAGFACELERRIELSDRTVTSATRLTNRGDVPLVLQWFAHPFWALTNGRAAVALPAGTTIPENPGFVVATDGSLTFQRPFVAPTDDQFALLTLPPGRELTLTLDHPCLARVTFATSFVPTECPVWANAHTISVEPYLAIDLAPGETRTWHVRHGFEAELAAK